MAPQASEPPSGVVAIGDPQASSEKFFGVVESKGLLTLDGWLRPDVKLVSIGDRGPDASVIPRTAGDPAT